MLRMDLGAATHPHVPCTVSQLQWVWVETEQQGKITFSVESLLFGCFAPNALASSCSGLFPLRR